MEFAANNSLGQIVQLKNILENVYCGLGMFTVSYTIL